MRKRDHGVVPWFPFLNYFIYYWPVTGDNLQDCGKICCTLKDLTGAKGIFHAAKVTSLALLQTKAMQIVVTEKMTHPDPRQNNLFYLI